MTRKQVGLFERLSCVRSNCTAVASYSYIDRDGLVNVCVAHDLELRQSAKREGVEIRDWFYPVTV